MSNHTTPEPLTDEERYQRKLHTLQDDLWRAQQILSVHKRGAVKQRIRALGQDDPAETQYHHNLARYHSRKASRWANEVEECRRLIRDHKENNQ